MFGTALIVFREVLEAALIVSIVAAATRGLAHRFRFIGGGVAAGMLGAILVALSAKAISHVASGIGQELFNAGVLLAAVALISWHILWMARHGREMAMQMKAVSAAVVAGNRPPTALLLVVAIAILREGSEVVLFLYGIAAGGSSVSSLVAGGVLGLAVGVAFGLALYLGLLKIPAGKMFNATNTLLLLVAAGMASQAARFLVQADLLPALGQPLWDTSFLLGNGGVLGKLLHALIGYDAQPAGMQILFFVVVFAAVGGAMCMQKKPGAPVAKPKQPAVQLS